MEDNHFWGSGWSFPPTFEVGNHQLNLTRKEANINQSIDIILQTQRGERSMNSSFGSPLRNFSFKDMNETLKGEIKEAVKTTLLHYEPRIKVDEVDVAFVDNLKGEVKVNIFYTIKKTNTRHNYVFPFSIREGTNL